ncbi:MAG: ion channel [Phycisphaerales bacterium]
MLELMSAIMSAHISVAVRAYRPNHRTFAMASAAYLEPVAQFATLAVLLPVAVGVPDSVMYAGLPVGGWDAVSAVYFSVGRYTTIGSSISASHVLSRTLATVETLCGVVLLLFTINSFLASSESSPFGGDGERA